MSKFLLNLLLQRLAIFKNQISFGKNFSFTFGPSGLSAQTRPIFFSFQPAVFLPPSPLGLSLSASPSRPLGLVDRASVVPYQIVASHTGKRLTSSHLRPSPCLVDRWDPPVITFLWLRLSSTPRRRLIEPPCLLCPPSHPLSLWPTFTTP
jgi:hypothetical protein